MSPSLAPVIVIGAGPIGLAAAAHLVSRGLEPLVLEAGAEVGAAVRAWGHVRMFSPWRYNTDPAAKALLDAEGWAAPDPDAYPTGAELMAQYLAPLAATAALRGRIRTGARVVGVARRDHGRLHQSEGRDAAPFIVTIAMADGAMEALHATAVIDCAGTWHAPNPGGAHGIPAPGEAAHPLGVAALILTGGKAAMVFAVLHGMGNGVLTIAKGTLPLAVFGPSGYGARQGLIGAPARLMLAASPFLFGLVLEGAGAQAALLLTSACSLVALTALLLLRQATPSLVAR